MTTGGNFNQAAVDLNNWMAAHRGRPMEVPTDELYGIFLQDWNGQQTDMDCFLGLQVLALGASHHHPCDVRRHQRVKESCQ